MCWIKNIIDVTNMSPWCIKILKTGKTKQINLIKLLNIILYIFKDVSLLMLSSSWHYLTKIYQIQPVQMCIIESVERLVVADGGSATLNTKQYSFIEFKNKQKNDHQWSSYRIAGNNSLRAYESYRPREKIIVGINNNDIL